MSAIMLTACVERGATVPLQLTQAEAKPIDADIAQIPVPKTKPKPPAASGANVPVARKPAPDASVAAAQAHDDMAEADRGGSANPEAHQANTGSVVLVPPAAPLPEPLPAPAESLPSALPPPAPPSITNSAPSEHPGPKALVGLDEQATVRLLGEPSWTEDVPPAKYWQYATPSCVLRVFFFMEMTTQNFRALSYELTSSDDAPNVHERCFAQLLAQASGRQTAHGNRIN
jgi:hypothetical protein